MTSSYYYFVFCGMIEFGVSFVLFDYSSGNSLHIKQRILLLLERAIVLLVVVVKASSVLLLLNVLIDDVFVNFMRV